MDNDTDKRDALRQLADDLRQWEKACREWPIQDLVLATVLARVAADCEQLVVALSQKPEAE